MGRVEQLVNGWTQAGLIPGASLRVMHKGELRIACDAGILHRERPHAVDRTTLFDLASLTKVVATLPAALLLVEKGLIKLDDPLARFFPTCPADKRAITIRQLLTHTAGLPAGLQVERRDARLKVPDAIFALPLLHPPGTQVVYSDLGMILLGLIVEQAAGQALDRFTAEQVFAPLGMLETCFKPDRGWSGRIAATEYCAIQQAYIVGDVHDEKAFVMGGVAGHAGLFAPADDLVRYARFWLYGEGKLFADEWRHAAARCHTDGLGGHRGLGWESNHGPVTVSCGSRFSAASFGHTGFTGTSLWIDPEQDVAVVFLTNAVHAGRNNFIRKLRPILHDAVIAQLQGTEP
ncbi:beta-lactamase family protein [Brevibacillus sp. SYP-B805]|uniref:serine hydrolase domain-containing protein n=1 Tax=Brevibacillus sp. SYP-B805 TaxID=1578199 RepID=UPI0013EAC76E|nr:serine hydrolase domain-containing protein [Brevibacillus sp. SYP-B805]NGQ94895.1 beta-lactamase family protein [Brevibacillus sp. SYP-B805]